jgi:hypothetical protein
VEYFSCPNLFIASCAREFLEEHSYLEQHPHTAPHFHAQRPRFVAFRTYFLNTVADFRTAMKTGVGMNLPGVA